MNQPPLNPIIINPDAARPQYAIIWMHGLGANAQDFITLPMELNLPRTLKFRFILTNAPLRAVTINQGMHMPAWFDIKSLTDLDNEDTVGIHESQAKVQQVIETQIADGSQSQHIFLGGFSQGAATALFTGLQYKAQLAGIIALSGYIPLTDSIQKQGNATYNTQLPIFIGHGALDSVVPIVLAKRSQAILHNLGYPVSYHAYNAAHQVPPEEWRDLRQWIIKQTR